MDMNDPNKYRESAADRAHGTHGRGRTEERRLDDPVVSPGVARGLGEPAWGSGTHLPLSVRTRPGGRANSERLVPRRRPGPRRRLRADSLPDWTPAYAGEL